MARQIVLFSFASLVGVLGLGMANLATYNALLIGVVWAAGVVVVADFAIAAIVLLVVSKSHADEIDVAFEVQRTALGSIHKDARYLKVTIDALGREIGSVRENITAIVHNPLDVATEKLLVPTALSSRRLLDFDTSTPEEVALAREKMRLAIG